MKEFKLTRIRHRDPATAERVLGTVLWLALAAFLIMNSRG